MRRSTQQVPDVPPVRRTDCRSCRHHFVTWDVERPHGCHAYGFKSQGLPSVQVLQLSGVKCQLHEPRPPRARDTTPRR